MTKLILNLSCPDRPGIVAATSKTLAENGANITESHQFGDIKESGANSFFMRVAFDITDPAPLKKEFAATAKDFAMDYNFYDAAARVRAIIMVSKFDHCVSDLIYRSAIGSLSLDIAAIISNHRVAEAAAEAAGIPFYYNEDKQANEETLKSLIASEGVELTILARYMQVLSPQLVRDHPAAIINIHHSFLPSFKGAEPYSQAHQRGVKMIGASAHFVTAALDEGPIITQGVAPSRHDMRVEDLIDVGRDVERRTLAAAIKLYLQRRVLVNGEKTVIFE